MNKENKQPGKEGEQPVDRMKKFFSQIPQGEYQLCPLCHGQGTVSKPEWVAGDIDQWSGTSAIHVCHVCNGNKVIARPSGGEEKRFTLAEALEIWDKGQEYGFDAARSDDWGDDAESPNKQQYFKDKFNIDL